MMALGFQILPLPKKRKLLEKNRLGEIAEAEGEGRLPLYLVTSLRTLGEEDVFRIEKILRLYEEKPEITAFGPERVKILSELVEKYSKALSSQKGAGLSGPELEMYSLAAYIMSGDGLGPLSLFLEDDSLEEIMVNGIGKPIYVYHRKFGMCRSNVCFTDRRYFIEKANQVLSVIGRRVDEGHPRAHGVLQNGDRIAAIIPPYSSDCTIDIRKFSARPFTVADLAGRGMLSLEAAAFLWIAFEAGCNIGIVGNTGAGKTSLLNALFRFVPADQRVICVEETPEIKILQEQSVRMISVENLGITLKDAILDSLRLRPGRVIIGEVRTEEEASALKESLLAGQALGTYFTYHAENSGFALRRLSEQGIMPRDLSAIDLLVVCKRFEQKGRHTQRAVSEIVEVLDPLDEGDGIPRTRSLFSFDFEKMRMKRVGNPAKSEIAKRLGKLYLRGADFGREMKKKEAQLRGMNGITDGLFFEKVQEDNG